MKATVCDNCRRVGPSPPLGWVSAVLIAPPSCSGEGWMARYVGNAEYSNNLVGTFCTWQCLTEYATARVLLGDLSDGRY